MSYTKSFTHWGKQFFQNSYRRAPANKKKIETRLGMHRSDVFSPDTNTCAFGIPDPAILSVSRRYLISVLDWCIPKQDTKPQQVWTTERTMKPKWPFINTSLMVQMYSQVQTRVVELKLWSLTWPWAQRKHQRGCASSGRLPPHTPWQSKHALVSGNTQTGWPGTGGGHCWPSRKSSSRTSDWQREEETVWVTAARGSLKFCTHPLEEKRRPR